MNSADKIAVFDTTLRDGEQSPGGESPAAEDLFAAREVATTTASY